MGKRKVDEYISQRNYLPEDIIDVIKDIMYKNEYVIRVYHSMLASDLMVPEDLNNPLFLANCVIALNNAYIAQKEISCRYAMLVSPPPVKVGEGIVWIGDDTVDHE